MKKLLLILLPISLFLVSCGGGEGDDLQPIEPPILSLEEVLVGGKWCLSNPVENGFKLSETGEFMITEKCIPHMTLGFWIIEDSLIKYSYINNSIQTTVLWGKVSEYSANQIKILLNSDSISTTEAIYSLTPEDVYGCVDVLALNFNPLADCDDGSCQFDFGCTDSLAYNYDSTVTFDDGSCLYSADVTFYLDVSGANYFVNLGVQYLDIYAEGIYVGSLSTNLGFTYIPLCNPPEPDAVNLSLDLQNSSPTTFSWEVRDGSNGFLYYQGTELISANDCLTLGLSNKKIQNYLSSK